MKIAIAGAGLLGRLLAWQLAARGHEVHLCDRDDGSGEQSAGWMAAAMLAPYSEMLSAEPVVFQQGRAALQRWPELVALLGEITGTNTVTTVPVQFKGSVVVAHGQDAADLQRFQQRLLRCPELPADSVLSLNHQQLGELEPELAQVFRSGIYLPEEGCVANWHLYRAMAEACDTLEVQWHRHTEIVAVEPHVIKTRDFELPCDLALDCRGFGGKHQLQNFRGVRGEVMWVHAADVGLQRPVRLMHPRYQLYIAPKPDQVYVIGATELESESLAPITVRSSLELLSALYSVHRGFAEAEILKAYAGCRPGFMDNLPRIEASDGLLRVNGLYRHGYLLSPIVSSDVLSLVAGETNFLWPEIIVQQSAEQFA